MFNHYAKIKRILKEYNNWYIIKINKPTETKNLKGEILKYNQYYRIYDCNNNPIKYCKFQQLDRLSEILKLNIEELELLIRNN